MQAPRSGLSSRRFLLVDDLAAAEERFSPPQSSCVGRARVGGVFLQVREKLDVSG